MSSHLIRQDLIPIVSGYVLWMGALAIGLLMLQHQRRRPAADRRPKRDRRPARDRGPTGDASGPAGLASTGDDGETAARRALLALRRPGWPRLIRHLAATAIGGYLVLMAIVLLYYYGVAKVAGSFLDSAVTGCALLIGLSAPVFIAASWLRERIRRRPADRTERGDRQPAGET